MELTTGLLTQEQMQAELDAILSLLTGSESRDVEIMYGFGCQVEEPYQTLTVSVAALSAFISQAQREGVWRLGEDDLHITVSDPDTEYLLCHESDVHVTSVDSQVLKFFTTRWLTQGYTAHQKRDEKWEPLTPEAKQSPV